MNRAVLRSVAGSRLPSRVTIVEVGPRDGLQNEVPVSTENKLELIHRLCSNGLKFVESTSFVSPKWTPQMADHKEIMKGLPREKFPDVHFPVLTPNLKGLEGAIEGGADSVAIFTATSEGFTKKNINCSVEESLKRFEPVLSLAKQNNIPVRGYLSTVFGCPYDGLPTDFKKTYQLIKELKTMGCYEISLGDTIGVASPGVVDRFFDGYLKENDMPSLHSEVAVHFHNTYGYALANIMTSLSHGISIVDSSIAGLGGCPYAEGATGNVSTEEVVFMLEEAGIDTGCNLEGLVETGEWISEVIGKKKRSRVSHKLIDKYRWSKA
eukprot:GDKJ01019725.1.p1 GENE.GDKJ01019725.1~~GDKJ01019725.1.p1  ORF type:complete len:323 (+),score=70.68 GDKJ01019725.1:10-978(+)